MREWSGGWGVVIRDEEWEEWWLGMSIGNMSSDGEDADRYFLKLKIYSDVGDIVVVTLLFCELRTESIWAEAERGAG
jgi:hypothetical protein